MRRLGWFGIMVLMNTMMAGNVLAQQSAPGQTRPGSPGMMQMAEIHRQMGEMMRQPQEKK